MIYAMLRPLKAPHIATLSCLHTYAMALLYADIIATFFSLRYVTLFRRHCHIVIAARSRHVYYASAMPPFSAIAIRH